MGKFRCADSVIALGLCQNIVILEFCSRSSILVVVLLILLTPAIQADTKGKKIAVIDSQNSFPYSTVRDAMLEELSAHGFTKEAGFTYDYFSLGHYSGTAKNLWKHKIQNKGYDAIFLTGTVAVTAFREIAWMSPGYPFIYAIVTDPVGLGLIAHHDRAPTGNFSSVAYQVPIDKRLDFVRQLIPGVKNIGFVYADMLQSQSYRKWLEKLLQKKEWEGVILHARKVSFIPSEGGHRRMAQEAKHYIQELDPIVDVFLSSSDQMGVQKPYVEMVAKTTTKPLIGLSLADVEWGATATMYADIEGIGQQAAHMLERILNGEQLKPSFLNFQRSSAL